MENKEEEMLRRTIKQLEKLVVVKEEIIREQRYLIDQQQNQIQGLLEYQDRYYRKDYDSSAIQPRYSFGTKPPF